MAGGVGLVGGAAYGATKASLEAMTRAWAVEYSASGVRVNAIAPGPERRAQSDLSSTHRRRPGDDASNWIDVPSQTE
jgi:NAD(P)-dependent dehydrogenase (short-subunit alcohol dehydrogenase family)